MWVVLCDLVFDWMNVACICNILNLVILYDVMLLLVCGVWFKF